MSTHYAWKFLSKRLRDVEKKFESIIISIYDGNTIVCVPAAAYSLLLKAFKLALMR